MEKTLLELQQERDAVRDSMQKLVQKAEEEKRDLTPEEAKQFDDGDVSQRSLSDRIKRKQTLSDFENGQRITKPSKSQLETGNVPPREPARANKWSGSLRCFRDNPERAYDFAHWFLAGPCRHLSVMDSAVEVAQERCRQRGIEYRVQTEGSNTAGGYLVPDQFIGDLIRLVEERGVTRRECRVIPMGSDSAVIPRMTGGFTTYFIGENTEITASDPTWDQIRLTPKTVAVLTRISSSLNEDSAIALIDTLATDMAYRIADIEDKCLFIGDGTSTYGGMFGVSPKANDGNHAGTLYTALTGNTAFSTMDLADFEGMIGQLPAYAAQNAKWFISRPGFYASMQRLMDAGGGNTIDSLAAGTRGIQFLGFPVVISQVMNTTLTAQTSTAGLAVFGDMRQGSTFGDRRQLAISTSMERYFEYDQIGVRATSRFDVNVHELGGAAGTAGSLIVLKTPSS